MSLLTPAGRERTVCVARWRSIPVKWVVEVLVMRWSAGCQAPAWSNAGELRRGLDIVGLAVPAVGGVTLPQRRVVRVQNAYLGHVPSSSVTGKFSASRSTMSRQARRACRGW